MELAIAVSVLVMLTGILSPALIRYVEKGRERRDAQSIEMTYSALAGALYDEAAYDAVKRGLGVNGVYSAPIPLSALFLQEDGFADAVRDYIPAEPQLTSRKAREPEGRGTIMVSIREELDPATGIRAVRAAVWAGDAVHCAGEEFAAGVLPEEVAEAQ